MSWMGCLYLLEITRMSEMRGTGANHGEKMTGVRQGHGFGLKCEICLILALEECSSARLDVGESTAYASHFKGGDRMTTKPARGNGPARGSCCCLMYEVPELR